MYTTKYPINALALNGQQKFPVKKKTDAPVSLSYTTIKDPYTKPKPKQIRRRKEPSGKWSQEWAFVQNPKKGQTAGYFNTYPYMKEPYVSTKTYLPNSEASNAALAMKQKDYRRNQETFEQVAQSDAKKREAMMEKRARDYGSGQEFKAFGSADARRRDEFSLDIRARQWKETLKTEENFTKASIMANAGKNISQPLDVKPGETMEEARRRRYEDKYAERPELFQTRVPFNLYDIGKEGGSTPFCNKSAKDTFYDIHRVANMGVRRPGSCPTSYETYGNFDYYPTDKPKFGRITETKHFYDHSHLNV